MLELIGIVVRQPLRRREVARHADDVEPRRLAIALAQALLDKSDREMGDIDADPVAPEPLRRIDRRAASAERIEHRVAGIGRCRHDPFEQPAPQILLVAPPAVSRTENADFKAMFAGGDEASRHLAPLYARLADEVGCGFFDAGSVAATSPLDGVHLDAENTRRIGAALAPVVRVMLEL